MLAWVLQNIGQLDEAEELNENILKTCKEFFGEKDFDTLTSYNAKGVLYLMREKLDLAEDFVRSAAEGREEILNRTHPSILNALTNLSMV